ncbi:ubiquinone biosynthesis O-methyltransferase, mitochondrial-like [Arctopsyche grandis]|uniref:ubiquinone biosynthesis O-methyltransferase, mitochondrial-like n=1 Tax=Arctopsyche grandis TaxID=121162 RepID=UPI00406DA1C6
MWKKTLQISSLHRNKTFVRTFSVERNSKEKKTTIDDAQVKVLEEFRDNWWDIKGPAIALHAYNHLRVPFIRDGLFNTIPDQIKYKDSKTPLQGLKLIDIGCGGGILSEALAKEGAKVDGVDASSELIFSAKSHADLNADLKTTLNYIHSTIEDHSEKHDEAYDALVASEVIEHIVEKDLFVEKCVKSVKTGGSLFFTTFNRTSLARFFGIFLAENVLKCIPKGTHDYSLFISPENLSKILEKHGCRTTLIKGSNYDPFKNEWYWLNSLQFCYALQAVKT